MKNSSEFFLILQNSPASLRVHMFVLKYSKIYLDKITAMYFTNCKSMEGEFLTKQIYNIC
jgi:hypothetical protein